eukprot:3249352-Rhodomonas_salina.1
MAALRALLIKKLEVPGSSVAAQCLGLTRVLIRCEMLQCPGLTFSPRPSRFQKTETQTMRATQERRRCDPFLASFSK